MTQPTFAPSPSTEQYDQQSWGQPSYGTPQPTQQQYGDHQYGQSQYGDHQYAQQYPQQQYPQQYGRPAAGTTRRFGISSAVGLLGTAGVAAAFTVLQWFRNDYSSFGGGANDASFSDVHDALDKVSSQADGTPFANLLDTGMAPAFFGWLGWALFAAAVIATAVAVSPLGNDIARGIGAMTGLAGVVLTAINLQLFTVSDELAKISKDVPGSYVDWVKHSSFGAWAAAAGFLLLGLAAAIGPRRR